MRIAAELTGAVGGQKRSSDRASVRMSAGFRDGPERTNVDVIDLSPTGVKIESHLYLSPDSLIWIKLPGLEAWQARIAWVRRHQAGCEFVRPLHPAVFERVVTACRAAAGR
ncbi:MAG: PilZ protein [Alphaproteobacteria bacterium]|nr:PilZ protein [Alphaproteobacteria bacterium]